MNNHRSKLLVSPIFALAALACSGNGSSSNSNSGTGAVSGASTTSTGGGSNTGGSNTGGSSAGGAQSGGTTSGGATSGGTTSGGSSTGGTGTQSGGSSTGGAAGANPAGTCSPATAIHTSAGSQALCDSKGQGNPDAWWAFGSYDVYDNMWNCNQGYTLGPETIYACSQSSWLVVSGQWSQSGACMTYPATQVDFNSGKGIPISNYTSISSKFSEASPHVGIYESTYDIWINGIAKPPTSTEIMIWVENYHQTPAGNIVDTTTLGGKSYDVWASSDHSYLAFVPKTPFSSGTLDLLGFFKYVMGKGWIGANSTLNQIGFGFEIVSTQSPNPTVNDHDTANFYLNDYSVTCSPTCT